MDKNVPTDTDTRLVIFLTGFSLKRFNPQLIPIDTTVGGPLVKADLLHPRPGNKFMSSYGGLRMKPSTLVVP